MNADQFTIDTNILVYALDFRAGNRRRLAAEIIDRSLCLDCRLTLQAVSEFYAATIRKQLVPPAEAAAQVEDWLTMFPTVAPSASAIRKAVGAAREGKASYWDALLIASA